MGLPLGGNMGLPLGSQRLVGLPGFGLELLVPELAVTGMPRDGYSYE